MKYLLKLILDSIKQGCLYVMSRPLFLVSIVAIPLVSAFLMLIESHEDVASILKMDKYILIQMLVYFFLLNFLLFLYFP